MAGRTAGIDERRLRRSSALAGAGDGLVATALPLIAVALTRDPLAVATVVAAQHLPWVLVALLGRRLVGRGDRRTVLGAVDTVRAVTLGALGFLTLAGTETILIVQTAALVVGLAEALSHDAEADTVDLLAPGRDGATAGGVVSARGMAGLGVGMVLSGFLFEVVAALPLLVEVFVFALAALFALSLRARVVSPRAVDVGGIEVGAAPAKGTALLTTVAALASAATSAVLGVLALFAVDDLGLGAPAFGLLLAGLALASGAGGLAAPEVGRVLGLRGGLVASLLAVGAGHAAAGLTADPASPWTSAAGLGAAAAAAMSAGVLARALLHVMAGRVVDGPALRTFHLAVWAAIPSGALAGGLAARGTGVADLVVLAGAASGVAGLLALFARPRPQSAPAGPASDRALAER